MTTRKWLGILASVLALAAGTPTSAAEQGNSQACSPVGSWFGYDPAGTAYWMSTFHGSSSSGTYELDIPGVDVSPFFYGAVRASTFRGTWTRTSGNTIAFTVIGYALDASGVVLGIAKLSGIDTLIDNCSTLSITNTLELYGPTVNPFESQGYPISLADHYGYRMRVTPPAN